MVADRPAESVTEHPAEASTVRTVPRARLDPKGLAGARLMGLDRLPLSDAAKILTDEIAGRVIAWETSTRSRKKGPRKNQRRGDRLRAFTRCIGRMVADLLIAAKDDRWSSRGMSQKDFTGEAVSYRDFKSAFDALRATRLIKVKKGYTSFSTEGWGDRGYVTRLRATSRLLALAASHGIELETVSSHYAAELPRNPLVKKAAGTRRRGQKIGGRKMRVPETDARAAALRSEVQELNEFLTERTIDGGEFRGFRRIFNCGDQPGFDWNKGGRLYCVGVKEGYQGLKQDARLRMRIDGQPVVEIDIRASHLTILYAKLGQTLDMDRDPYDVPPVPREVVKAWIAMTLGQKVFHKRWPGERRDELEEAGFDVRGSLKVTSVREAVLTRHPILATWPSVDIGWFDLQYWESNAIVATMLYLKREHAIPCLPVHDSIIVPETHADFAARTLSFYYLRCTGAVCELKWQQSGQAAEPVGWRIIG